MAKFCFICHKEISRKAGNETVEHIPMRSLFEGYESEHKINRITVPCCRECNNETSLLDEEFRNFIGSISDSPRHIGMADKTVKSVLDYRKMYDRIHEDPDTGRLGLLTPVEAVAEYQKKIFRGLFYHQYKITLPPNLKLSVDLGLKDEIRTTTERMIQYYERNFPVKYSGSPTVFRYILQPFRENLNLSEKKDLCLESTDTRFVSIHVFNECFTSVVYATVRE
jgi:hypothetical protein